MQHSYFSRFCSPRPKITSSNWGCFIQKVLHLQQRCGIKIAIEWSTHLLFFFSDCYFPFCFYENSVTCGKKTHPFPAQKSSLEALKSTVIFIMMTEWLWSDKDLCQQARWWRKRLSSLHTWGVGSKQEENATTHLHYQVSMPSCTWDNCVQVSFFSVKSLFKEWNSSPCLDVYRTTKSWTPHIIISYN